MATITTISPFVNGTPLTASTWNTKYNLLYNEINGNLDNYNVMSTAGLTESNLVFSNAGHTHSGSKAITLASISTVGAK